MIVLVTLIISDPYQLLQELLKEAAKARIRRMVKEHKSRKGLNVPDFIKKAWAEQDQSAMAKILMDSNWDKELYGLNPWAHGWRKYIRILVL